MSLFGALLAPRANIAAPMDDRYWSPMSMATTPTLSGVRIDPDTALKIGTVWRCVALISQTIASLPVILYEQVDDDTKRRATDQPLWPLLHRQPNRYQSRFGYIETMMTHALLRGNAYAQILPGPRGPFGELMPLHPDLVRLVTLPNGTQVYKLRQADLTEKTLNADEVFHLVGPSQDGRTGMSTIAFGAEAFGLTKATEMYGAAFFGNGSRPGGTLTSTKALGREAKERLKADFESLYRGVQSAFRTVVLEDGMTFNPVSISPLDAELLKEREYNAEDVCRWFGVPPHLAGLTGKATSWGTGIGELTLGYLKFTILPWLERWEGAIELQLLVDPDRYFVEFQTAGLERADLATRTAAYQIAAGGQAPWISRNEVRRLENLEPVDGLDDMLAPLNMATVGDPPPDVPPIEPDPTVPTGLSGHYRAMVEDAAARLVRKEIAAVGKLAKKNADDPAGWHSAVGEFYVLHALDVEEILHLSEGDARHYCAENVAALVLGGVRAMAEWETTRTVGLIALVEEAARVAA